MSQVWEECRVSDPYKLLKITWRWLDLVTNSLRPSVMSAETSLRKSSTYSYYLEAYCSPMLKNRKAFLKFNFNYSHHYTLLTSEWLLIVMWSMANIVLNFLYPYEACKYQAPCWKCLKIRQAWVLAKFSKLFSTELHYYTGFIFYYLCSGVFVRIKEHCLHSECLKCAQCGRNLKNIGKLDRNMWVILCCGSEWWQILFELLSSCVTL